MRKPTARPIPPDVPANATPRGPRAFAPDEVAALSERVEVFADQPADAIVPARPPRLLGRVGKLAWTAAGILVSMALALAAERLIRDLFGTNEWLGWFGVAVLATLVLALVALAAREIGAIARLRKLDALKRHAARALESDLRKDGEALLRELDGLYSARADLARPRQALSEGARDLFDGSEFVRLAERMLMAPLDQRARALTAASARRVALVTTVSPRALIDIAFVIFESVRLGGDIARLYGARPGLAGSLRLAGAILSHLAVTGGLVLTDGVMEQLLGQGLATRLSARLGEGVVNGLMTVRVGIAAIRVVRPLPFTTQNQPVVRDFIPELANVLQREPTR